MRSAMLFGVDARNSGDDAAAASVAWTLEHREGWSPTVDLADRAENRNRSSTRVDRAASRTSASAIAVLRLTMDLGMSLDDMIKTSGGGGKGKGKGGAVKKASTTKARAAAAAPCRKQRKNAGAGAASLSSLMAGGGPAAALTAPKATLDSMMAGGGGGGRPGGGRGGGGRGGGAPAKKPLTIGTKLRIGNLALGVTQADVQELFSAKGIVKSAELLTKPDGSSRGVAFVTYQRKADAEAAMKEYNGVPLDDKELKITIVASGAVISARRLAAAAGWTRRSGREGGGRGGRRRRPRRRGARRPRRKPRAGAAGAAAGAAAARAADASSLDAALDSYMAKTTE